MPTSEDLLRSAFQLHQAKRLAEAAALYRTVLQSDPDNFDALHLLGVAEHADGRSDLAAALVTRALALNPDAPDALFNLSQIEVARGCLTKAITHLRHALDLRPDYAVAQAELAHLLKEQAWRACGTPAFDKFLNTTNRTRFPDLPASDFDIYRLELHGFSDWATLSGFPQRQWELARTPMPDSLFASCPAHMHATLRGLDQAGRQPVGLVTDCPVDIIHKRSASSDDYYVVTAGHRHGLYDNDSFSYSDNIFPITYWSSRFRSAILSLPLSQYRTVGTAAPCLFLPSRYNYGHWLTDIFARMMIFEQVPELRSLPIVCFDLKEYQYETLELIGIPRSQVVSARAIAGETCADTLIQLSKASIASFVPFPLAHQWLRQRLMPAALRGTTGLPRRIYFSRRNYFPHTHRVANDAEVSDCLARHGFTTVFPEKLSVRETIELVANAEIIVGPWGGGTVNHVFLSDDALWVDLVGPQIQEGNWFTSVLLPQTMPLTGRYHIAAGRYARDAGLPTNPLRLFDEPYIIDPVQLIEAIRSIKPL